MAARVLMVLHSLDKGGAETLLINIFRNIDRDKVQFDFAVHTKKIGAYEEEITAMGGRIYRFEMWNGFNTRLYKKQWRKFFQQHQEFQTVHGHLASTACLYLKEAQLARRNTIMHCHGLFIPSGIKGKIKAAMAWKSQKYAQNFFTCSLEAGKNIFCEELYLQNKVQLIKNGVEVDKFKFDAKERGEIRAQLGIAENDFVVGHVGRFMQQKNHKVLIDIFNQIKGLNSNSKLLLVGDGELREEIENKIKELGIKNSVILTGVRKDVEKLLMAMDVAVFPSTTEGLPVTLIEMQVSGLKCFVSDVITKEVAVTDDIKFLPLAAPAIEWAQEVLKAKNLARVDNSAKMIEEGYHIAQTAKILQDFYLKTYKITEEESK